MTKVTIATEKREVEELFGLVSAGRELDELHLSSRSFNCLVKAGITSISEILIMDKNELQLIQGITKENILEIVRKIKEYKLKHPEMDVDNSTEYDFD